MPALTEHPGNHIVKTLLIGESGSGKTGALAGLFAAGYNLRVLDFDNGLSSLRSYLTDPNSEYIKSNPALLTQIKDPARFTYVILTDEMRAVSGQLIPKAAKAWPEALKMLTHWKEPAHGIDLGAVTTWGPKDVLVLDPLTSIATVAMNYHLQLNAALGATRTQNEARRDIGAVQAMLKKLFDLLKSDAIKCNVVLVSHITTVTEGGLKPQADDKGDLPTSYGYPSAVGRALSPEIPRWFDSCLLIKAEGTGTAVKRYIYTNPQMVSGNIISSKNAAPVATKSKYAIAHGLAEYFADVKGTAKQGTSA